MPFAPSVVSVLRALRGEAAVSSSAKALLEWPHEGEPRVRLLPASAGRRALAAVLLRALQMADLGRWLGGEYRVPGEDAPPDTGIDDDPSPTDRWPTH